MHRVQVSSHAVCTYAVICSLWGLLVFLHPPHIGFKSGSLTTSQLNLLWLYAFAYASLSSISKCFSPSSLHSIFPSLLLIKPCMTPVERRCTKLNLASSLTRVLNTCLCCGCVILQLVKKCIALVLLSIGNPVHQKFVLGMNCGKVSGSECGCVGTALGASWG